MLLRSLLLSLCLVPVLAQAALPQLRVTKDGRHLETVDGKPFLMMADTAWELFHRLTLEEADLYLKTRKEQGFNTILAVALAELDLTLPDAQGNMMLHDYNPEKPNEAYFAHVDAILKKAEALDLYVAFLPTWGDKWNKMWGKGPEIFTEENAAAYCEWLGRRYKDAPLIWVLGGDREVKTEKHRAIIRSMAAGLKKGDGGSHLMTFHPNGGQNSSQYWKNDEPWLDFHFFQSGHSKAKDKANYEYNLHNRKLTPVKPTMEGEPRYDDHPVRGVPDEGKVWYDSFDVRQAAWWNLMSGACGHTYGDHNIWQFYDGKVPGVFHARTPWKKALLHEGAVQMAHARKFFEALDWQKLEPDDDLLSGDKGEKGSRILAMRSTDGTFVVAYSPHGVPITLDMTRLKPANGEVLWFNPKTGEMAPAKALPRVTVGSAVTLAPPGQKTPERGADWALLVW